MANVSILLFNGKMLVCCGSVRSDPLLIALFRQLEESLFTSYPLFVTFYKQQAILGAFPSL